MQQLLTGCDCSLSEASTLQNQQQSQCLNVCNICLTCNICDICNISDISKIVSPISARFAIFKSPTIGNQTRFAINSIYLYSCDLFVWDSSGLTSSIQILPYQIIRCSIFVSCIYCEVSDDSLQHFRVWVCN